MRQHDGCALINQDGYLTHAKVWLRPTGSAGRMSPGGARQPSALEMSSLIRGVIVTVSADGPVRAYHNGEFVLSTVPKEPAEFAAASRL